jgi:hypothetical protein
MPTRGESSRDRSRLVPEPPIHRSSKDIAAVLNDEAALEEAFRKSFENAVRLHRKGGVPMVFWENDQIVEVPADQIPLPEDDPPPRKRRG